MDDKIERLMQTVREAADERTLQVRAYRDEGLSFGQIAKLLGISRQRVYQIYSRLVD